MNKILFSFLMMSILLSIGCSNPTSSQETKNPDIQDVPDIVPLAEKVLTKEERDALSPDDVLLLLEKGNIRFMNSNLTARDHSEQVRLSAPGQFPKAVVLSCLDSRVPVEDVFDRGIGDIFVGRVAGNFVNEDLLGSMEFGCKVAGAKVILVLGHEYCGAVKAAIDNVQLGNITSLVNNIRPAVEMVSYDGDRSSSNEEFVHLVCESNVKNTIQKIRTNSSILKEMEDNGEIKIVGAVYDMETGVVEFLN